MGSDTSTFTSLLVWNSDFLLSSICSTMTAISLYSRHNSEPVSWSPTPLLRITGGKWTEDLRSPTLWPDCKPVIVLCWRLPTEVGSGTMERVWTGPKVQRGEAVFRAPPLFPAASFPGKFCRILTAPLLTPPRVWPLGRHPLHSILFPDYLPPPCPLCSSSPGQTCSHCLCSHFSKGINWKGKDHATW